MWARSWCKTWSIRGAVQEGALTEHVRSKLASLWHHLCCEFGISGSGSGGRKQPASTRNRMWPRRSPPGAWDGTLSSTQSTRSTRRAERPTARRIGNREPLGVWWRSRPRRIAQCGRSMGVGATIATAATRSLALGRRGRPKEQSPDDRAGSGSGRMCGHRCVSVEGGSLHARRTDARSERRTTPPCA